MQSSDTVLYPVICQHRRSLRSAPITWTGAANIAADAGLSHLLTSFLAYFTKYCALMLRQLLCLVLANRGQRAAVTFIQFTAERCKCELEPQKGSKQVTLISCSRPQCTKKKTNFTFMTILSKSTTMLWRFSSAAKTSGRTEDIFSPLDSSITDLRLSKDSLQGKRCADKEDCQNN